MLCVTHNPVPLPTLVPLTRESRRRAQGELLPTLSSNNDGPAGAVGLQRVSVQRSGGNMSNCETRTKELRMAADKDWQGKWVEVGKP